MNEHQLVADARSKAAIPVVATTRALSPFSDIIGIPEADIRKRVFDRERLHENAAVDAFVTP
jgi:hypothetical protein